MTDRSELSFAAIALEWAGERHIDVKYVLGELVAAFWRGDFEHAGTTQIFMLVAPEGHGTRADGTVTRRSEDGRAFEVADRKKVPMSRDDFASVVLPTQTNIEWDGSPAGLSALAARPLSSWPAECVRCYYEEFRIARQDFLAWVQEAGRSRPKFWRAPPRTTRPAKAPRRRAESEAAVRRSIAEVLVKANRLWPDPKKRPKSFAAMAEEICRGTKWSPVTVRQILTGNYAPQKRRNLPGLQ
jgi:hypothetical protein